MSEHYHIVTVHDFFKVPEDRREICLREFLVWMAMVEATECLLSGLETEPVADFHWIDDDEHTAVVSVTAGDERIEIVNGVMKGFRP